MICAEGLRLGDAAQVAGGEAQPLEHGQLLGGQLVEELLPLVRSGGVFLAPLSNSSLTTQPASLPLLNSLATPLLSR